MEQKPSEALIHIPNPPHHDDPKPSPKGAKKRRGAMHFIKVALFMMRSRSGSNSKSLWRKLVGSVRPLPLHLQQVEPEAKAPQPMLTLESSPAHTDFSDDALFSPSAGSSRSTSDTPYASAVGLNEMVQGEVEEEQEECDSVSKDGEGDQMIDAKAEEFIANFYNQMKLQRRYSINERSLG